MAASKNVLIIIALLVTVSLVEIGMLVKISSPGFPVRPYLQKIWTNCEWNSFEQAFK